ncbi:hypothetical protein CR513_13375, partial [Mucuna pruriens]
MTNFLSQRPYPCLFPSKRLVILTPRNCLVDRYKTTFCIPNAQYQQKAILFGLKVTLSLFQEFMTKIFQLILNSSLI